MMETVKYIIISVIIISTTAGAIVYNDDFEDYPVGYNIADSAYWGDTYSEGILSVDRQNDNNYVYAENGGLITYDFCPPGEIADSTISFDFLFDGKKVSVSALFRLSSVTSSYPLGYVVSVLNDYSGDYGYGDYVMGGYYFEDGCEWYVPNIFFLGQTFVEGNWYHADMSLYGEPYARYEAVIDGTYYFSGSLEDYSNDTFLGYSGLTITLIDGGTIWVDDYTVDDAPRVTGIESASVGTIKAVFK